MNKTLKPADQRNRRIQTDRKMRTRTMATRSAGMRPSNAGSTQTTISTTGREHMTDRSVLNDNN